MNTNKFLASLLAGCFFIMLAVCGTAQASVLGGEISAGGTVQAIDMDSGIQISDGLGANTEFKVFTKHDVLGIAKLYGAVACSVDDGGPQNPLANIFSLGVGVMNDPNANLHFIGGITKLDFRNSMTSDDDDFMNSSGSGDAVKFHLEFDGKVYAEGIHNLSAILKGAGTIPIIRDEKDLRGVNASISLKDIIRGDERDIALALLVGMGFDDGSYGRRPAGIVFSEVYGLLDFPHNITVKFPYVKMAYVNGNNNGNNTGGGIVRDRDTEIASVGIDILCSF